MDKSQLVAYIRDVGGLQGGTDDEVISYASANNKEIAELVKQLEKPISPEQIEEKAKKYGGIREPNISEKFRDSFIGNIVSAFNPVEIARTYKEAPEESRGVETFMKGAEIGTNLLTGGRGIGFGNTARTGVARGVAPVEEISKAVAETGKAVQPALKRIGQAVARIPTNISNLVKSDKFASKIQGEFWAKNAAANAKYGDIIETAGKDILLDGSNIKVVENPEYLTKETLKLLDSIGDKITVKEAQTLLNKINKYIPEKSYSVAARPQDIANMEVVHNIRSAMSESIPELKAYKPEWARNKEIFKKLSRFMTDLDKTETAIRKGLNTNDTKAMNKMINEYFDAETVRQLGGYKRLYNTVGFIKKYAIPTALVGGAAATYSGLKK